MKSESATANLVGGSAVICVRRVSAGVRKNQGCTRLGESAGCKGVCEGAAAGNRSWGLARPDAGMFLAGEKAVGEGTGWGGASL